jgi:ribosome-associated toxin RatA of RatAB toxin-antitoxin module
LTVTTDEEQIGDKVFQVGRVTINASPSQVQSVLTDYPHTAKIFDNVTKCNIVSDKGNTKLIAFTIKSMGNLWTFDYVLEVKEEPGSIQWHRSSGAFKANDGFWKLEPVNGGAKTQVTYAKYVDGGMLLPKCVVNKQIRDSMPLIMTSLKTTAEQSTVATTRTLPHN